MRYLIFPLLGSLFFTSACGSSCIGRGVSLYEEHNYIEAAEAFERTQNRLTTMEAVDRIRYGLYRGLTLVALGDLRGGERWLDYAETQQRALPELLPVNERTLLARGRVNLNHQLQAALPKPEPQWTQGVATSGAPSDGRQ